MIPNIVDLYDSMNLRYERKFITAIRSKHEVMSIVRQNPAMFSEVYPQRSINNIYLDTCRLTSYFESEDGVSERVKTRIRWYGDLFGHITEPVLEMKTRNGFMGGKLRFPLEPFHFGQGCSPEMLKDVFNRSSMPGLLREYLRSMVFTIINRYSRKYFESADHKFRITVDFDLEYCGIQNAGHFCTEWLEDYEKVILEMKYNRADDCQARLFTSCLPFRVTKNSKYIAGMKLLGRVPV